MSLEDMRENFTTRNPRMETTPPDDPTTETPTMDNSSSELMPEQLHALLDILTHHQVYEEVCAFKEPDCIQNYGYPFSGTSDDIIVRKTSSSTSRSSPSVSTSTSTSTSTSAYTTANSTTTSLPIANNETTSQTSPTSTPNDPTSPLMRLLFTRIILKLPYLNTLPQSFWQTQIGPLVEELAKAELSESYDKGAMGTRKTLATASSAIIEGLVRGFVGGCPRVDGGESGVQEKEKFDRTKAEDLKRAYDMAASELVYGNLLDGLFDGMAESDKLEDLSELVQVAVEHVLILAASFVHHVFVLSPDGQYLLKLLSNVNKLIPYMAIKQTLRVGNAATMINGMLKLLLTKLSVTAFTNWIGLSKNSDDGVNLLQQIISTVLTWDNTDFQKTLTSITKSKSPPPPTPTHIDALTTHITSSSRSTHISLRTLSLETQKPLTTIIFENAQYPPTESLTPAQQEQAQAYLSAKLSIRDRKELIRVLCHQHPDIFTSTIRDVVAAYDPLIRSIHNGVDLTAGVSDLQAFIDDTIKTVRRKGEGKSEAPSVEDFVELFRRHLPSCLRFLHQVAKNCPDISEQFRGYSKEMIVQFRSDPATTTDTSSQSSSPVAGAAGDLTPHLTTLFTNLEASKKEAVISQLSSHAKYLQHLSSQSAQRTQSILDNRSRTMYGPGVYLARWHGLLDETLITPATEGHVRRGADVNFLGKGGVASAASSAEHSHKHSGGHGHHGHGHHGHTHSHGSKEKNEETENGKENKRSKDKSEWWDVEGVAKQVLEGEAGMEAPDVGDVIGAFEGWWRGVGA